MLIATSAQAQVTFSVGPHAGLNVSTVHYTDRPTTTTTYRPGFEAGLTGSLGFGHLALEPTLAYAQKGYHAQDEFNTGSTLIANYDDFRLNYLTLPVNLVYRQQADGQGFQLFAGPYVGALLGGHFYESSRANGNLLAEVSGQITAEKSSSTTPSRPQHRWDAGLQAGIGYRYKEVVFQAGYSLGLRNVQAESGFGPIAFDYTPYYNRAFQASLSYLFSLN
ncbi:porin family protein [Hymenobacter arcticus]